MLFQSFFIASGLIAYASALAAESPRMTAAPLAKRNDPPYMPNGYVYIGCYYQAATNKNLGQYSGKDMAEAGTIELCASECSQGPSAQYKYFGVQADSINSFCDCDNGLSNKTPYPESECDYACPGDDTEFCGSITNNRSSVYQFQGIPDDNALAAQSATYTLGYGTSYYPQVQVTTTSGSVGFSTTLATPVYNDQGSAIATGTVQVVVPTPSLYFTNVPGQGVNETIGSTVILSYFAPGSGPVTINLIEGPPNLMTQVGQSLTTDSTIGYFEWTLASDLTPGQDYALQIQQEGQNDNYSPTFGIIDAVVTTSSSSTSTTTSSSTSSTTPSSTSSTTSLFTPSTTVPSSTTSSISSSMSTMTTMQPPLYTNTGASVLPSVYTSDNLESTLSPLFPNSTTSSASMSTSSSSSILVIITSGVTTSTTTTSVAPSTNSDSSMMAGGSSSAVPDTFASTTSSMLVGVGSSTFMSTSTTTMPVSSGSATVSASPTSMTTLSSISIGGTSTATSSVLMESSTMTLGADSTSTTTSGSSMGSSTTTSLAIGSSIYSSAVYTTAPASSTTSSTITSYTTEYAYITIPATTTFTVTATTAPTTTITVFNTGTTTVYTTVYASTTTIITATGATFSTVYPLAASSTA